MTDDNNELDQEILDAERTAAMLEQTIILTELHIQRDLEGQAIRADVEKQMADLERESGL